MHPDRLNFLANRHKLSRAVVSRDVRANGTTLTLECGHFSFVAPHFDTKRAISYDCRECGRDYVKSAPQYAGEWGIEPTLKASLSLLQDRPFEAVKGSRIAKTIKAKE